MNESTNFRVLPPHQCPVKRRHLVNWKPAVALDSSMFLLLPLNASIIRSYRSYPRVVTESAHFSILMAFAQPGQPFSPLHPASPFPTPSPPSILCLAAKYEAPPRVHFSHRKPSVPSARPAPPQPFI